MANVILFDPNSSPVPNRVTRYIRSVQASDFSGPGVLVNTDASGDNPQVTGLMLEEIPLAQWKVVGSDVVALTAEDLRLEVKRNLDLARARRWSGKSATARLNRLKEGSLI